MLEVAFVRSYSNQDPDTEVGVNPVTKPLPFVFTEPVAFKAWYTNRVRDVERLTDRRLVAQGLREDSVKLRKQWSDLQTEIFAGERTLEDVYAHLAVIAPSTFRRSTKHPDHANL